MKHESIQLYYKEGGSDKVYMASLNETKGGWIVNFAYGRRGSALVPGTKTVKPVEYEDAKKIYDQLVRSKTSKGYTQAAGAATFTGTVNETRDTGFRPQLLNEISESEVIKLINDDSYCAQEKFDGRRRGLIKKGDTVTGTNRKGLSVELPDAIKKDALKKCHDFVLDGEAIGEMLYVFDILELDGVNLKNKSYDERYLTLLALIKTAKNSSIVVVDSMYSSEEKLKLYNKLTNDKAEGIVFKKLAAPYKAGRPNSGGDMLKFKFYSTLSAICAKVNTGKRSIALEIYGEGNHKISIGNVTVYPNQDIPKVGDVVEVKYLYYFKNGSLFQPVLIGVRDDLDQYDCTNKQLKYKQEDGDEEN